MNNYKILSYITKDKQIIEVKDKHPILSGGLKELYKQGIVNIYSVSRNNEVFTLGDIYDGATITEIKYYNAFPDIVFIYGKKSLGKEIIEEQIKKESDEFAAKMKKLQDEFNVKKEEITKSIFIVNNERNKRQNSIAKKMRDTFPFKIADYKDEYSNLNNQANSTPKEIDPKLLVNINAKKETISENEELILKNSETYIVKENYFVNTSPFGGLDSSSYWILPGDEMIYIKGEMFIDKQTRKSIRINDLTCLKIKTT